MWTSKASILVLALVATACSGPAKQVLLTSTAPELRIRPIVASVEIRDLSLPRYAASDDLVVLGEDGVVETVTNTVWADTPERSITLSLATNLGAITGARVASEPWPFSTSPEAQVVVTVTRLLGQPGGQLQFTGQYAISAVASSISDRSGSFNIVVPVEGTGPDALARAQGAAISQLSEIIARRLAR
ncbi:membrane integrity-associated transporter subunit PqiC [Pseudoruegeria sp. SK021]|uniref:PqiC family protein n=1 Tax=Pseudoruegeria sp. SK021 TaxID=1933035 RepID=UPI000A22469F|nr:PqiC family protein [Pseudoruegeria sp. SK021]OSP56811.1 hypothetical protein BV911_02395 [Pseudoruegeria sp. SK021]